MLQYNNQFIQFAKQLLDQPSSSSNYQNEQADRSIDISQLIQLQHTNQSPPQKEGQILLASEEPCNCCRSGCKKMYCECLAKGRLCSKYCKCFDCHNRTSNKLVLNVIEELDQNQQRKRYRSRRFKDGCTCQKSMCLKKYCECFSSGRRCGQGCKCINCENYRTKEAENIYLTPNQKKKTSKFTSKFPSTVSESLKIQLVEVEESQESDECIVFGILDFDQMKTQIVMVLGQYMNM